MRLFRMIISITNVEMSNISNNLRKRKSGTMSFPLEHP